LRIAFIAVCLLLSRPVASGHQTLYEAIEVNLHDPASIRIEFTIHAPELTSPLTAALDPAAVDPAWLPGLSDGEIESLTREAEAFIRSRFAIRWSGPDAPELTSSEIHFDPPEGVRNPPADTKLPPGCLLGTMQLANPGPPRSLTIGFAPDAQKRLMLAISRPAAFPEVHDLAAGESTTIALPEPPPPPPRDFLPPAIALAAGLLLAAGLALMARRRRAGCRMN
jgi:hypothetical protein